MMAFGHSDGRGTLAFWHCLFMVGLRDANHHGLP
jgi:hypothetical protein